MREYNSPFYKYFIRKNEKSEKIQQIKFSLKTQLKHDHLAQ